MEIFGRSSKAKRRKNVKTEEGGIYNHPLQFYNFPPTETISLQEFEEYAVERLKVLKAVETAGVRFNRNSNDYKDLLEKEIRKTNFKQLFSKTSEDGSSFKKLDNISHFILRLAYCRSEELRRWFLQQEMDFFRFRFQRLSKESQRDFLKVNNLNYDPIPEKERELFQEDLAAASNQSTAVVQTHEYFKVPFTETLDLVQRRRVFLHKGLAYVPWDDMISILLTVYRKHLSHSLAVTSRAVPHLEEDDRLLPMLCGLSKRYLGQDYANRKSTTGQITADMIDMLCKKSFPLCMQQLHQSMRQNHHLRHGGRQQYGLFLKGIGMSLEEAMKFWRTEFCKLIDGDKFDKQYSYAIRHNFGQEGKRTNYTPYSCMKIIMSNTPGPGDFHGCPFRHCDSDLLKQKLQAQGISKERLNQIIDKVKSGHYQVACQMNFDAVHHLEDTGLSINHPNTYFEESQRVLNGTRKDGQGTPKTPRMASSQNTPTSQKSQSSLSGSSQSAPIMQLSGIEEMEDDFPMEEMDQLMQEAQA